MHLEITEKKENQLLSRTELKGVVSFDKVTPATGDVRKEIARQLKAEEAVVAVKSIYGRFGFLKADVSAYVYKTKEAFGRIEPKIKEKKSKEGAAKEEKKESSE